MSLHAVRTLLCAAFLGAGGGAVAQTAPEAAADGWPRIEWEVKNRFRLFRNEADFKRHLAAQRGDGTLAAEQRLARASDGRGWARDVLANLCVDASGKVTELCTRDGRREVYLAPSEHRVGVVLTNAPSDARCTWRFDDGDQAQQKPAASCEQEASVLVRYGRRTEASVEITLPDQTIQRAATEIIVRDVLIAGMGDSVASGDGNPDRPVALSDQGFCFRRFLVSYQYFRPGRAGYRGDKACELGFDPTASEDWSQHGARWMGTPCHRSLYGYQARTALALAIENPHMAVTFIPIACTGATIEAGLLGQQRAREKACEGRASCPIVVQSQVGQLRDALALARRHRPDRNLDLVLLTIGANDINFSGLVADVMIEEGTTERSLFARAGMIASPEQAQRALANELPVSFAKLRATLKPLVNGNLSRVVYVSYGNPALYSGGTACPGSRHGFDIHPAFTIDPTRLRQVIDVVAEKLLPKVKALARCEGGGACKEPETDRMTFVDEHQRAFADHGFCARAESDPAFDRECFSVDGESFQPNPAIAATDPMSCDRVASEFRPYASRMRWIRTANDSYFTAMTYPEGLPSALQPSDIHDATWGATSAVYGGAIHPTAEGHAAMADAALPAAREVLGLAPVPAASIEAAPVPPASADDPPAAAEK